MISALPFFLFNKSNVATLLIVLWPLLFSLKIFKRKSHIWRKEEIQMSVLEGHLEINLKNVSKKIEN